MRTEVKLSKRLERHRFLVACSCFGAVDIMPVSGRRGSEFLRSAAAE